MQEHDRVSAAAQVDRDLTTEHVQYLKFHVEAPMRVG
jgi:hypothetical protein